MRWSVLAAAMWLSSATPCPAEEPEDALTRDLVSLVRDPRQPLRVRVEAAKTIGKLGPLASPAVPHLSAQVARLKGTELAPLQEAVIAALGEIGAASRPAVPVMTQSVGRSVDIDLAIRQSTAAILSAGESPETAVLLRQLQSREAGVRLRAIKTVETTRNRAVGPALTAALADPDGDVRRAAVRAVKAVLADALPVAELAKAYAADLTDPDDGHRLLAARALAKLGKAAAPATAALEAAQSDPDKDVRKAAADALAKISGS